MNLTLLTEQEAFDHLNAIAENKKRLSLESGNAIFWTVAGDLDLHVFPKQFEHWGENEDGTMVVRFWSKW